MKYDDILFGTVESASGPQDAIKQGGLDLNEHFRVVGLTAERDEETESGWTLKAKLERIGKVDNL